MNEIIDRFAVKGKVFSCERYGHGHINETYLVHCNSGCRYILQKISTAAFKDPEGLMENITSVTRYLSQRSKDPRSCLQMIPTHDGGAFYRDGRDYWRVYAFVEGSLALQRAETPEDFYNSGLAFGDFQRQLAEFPAESLRESIPDFHNTPVRYGQLRFALAADCKGRAALCGPELDFAFAREKDAGILTEALSDGRLPVRVTHNDTKINNILFDRATRKPLCVIDLDTVMPGSALYDYGDSIRFGASTAAEDEKDLEKVLCDMDLFRVYTEGFLKGCGGSLTSAEIELLPLGAKLMTLECGIRFLADYLNGDVYFHTQYEGQNLDRARTQFKLVADMESKWDTMQRIVREAAEGITRDRQ